MSNQRKSKVVQRAKKGVEAGETQHFLKNINDNIPEHWQQTKASEKKPAHCWEIEHVYGFSGDTYKSALFFGNSTDEIVYPAAALGVIRNTKDNSQKFFGGHCMDKNQAKYVDNWGCHQDDITNIDYQKDPKGRDICVTGEMGAKSTIHVWDLDTTKSINQFSLGGQAKGVAALGLSPCCRYIAVVDMSNDHNMYIFHTNKKKPIVTVSSGSDAISDIKWSRKINDLRFAALTTRSVQFWNPADSSKKLFKNGAFGTHFTQTKFGCVAWDHDGICYTGGENGLLHCWDQRGELGMTLKAHSTSVTAIVCNQGTLISTGKDFHISIHTADKGTFEFVKRIQMDTQHLASSIDFRDRIVVIGHDNGRIFKCNIDSEEQTTVCESHHDGEVWGLEVLPQKGTFLTCGDDNEFYEVDIKQKKVIRGGYVWLPEHNGGKAYETGKIRSTASTMCSFPSHQQGRAITYSSVHNHVAVANNHGDITIFSYDDFTHIVQKFKHPQEWVETMEYSPDNKFLAVGAHDDTIYIYKISEEGKYSLHYKIEYMHSSAITAIDWSKDSKYLRAIDQAYAKLYYDIIECVHIKDGSSVLTDPAIWFSATCKLGWDVMGVYPLGADGTDVNAIDTNEDRSLIAIGDDFGTMCVYRYPCLKMSHECHRMGGHSSHVTRCRFYETENPADMRIITAGGNDRCYIQWKQLDKAYDENKG